MIGNVSFHAVIVHLMHIHIRNSVMMMNICERVLAVSFVHMVSFLRITSGFINNFVM